MKKQIKLSKLPNEINRLAKANNKITRCVKNGNKNVGDKKEPYVQLEWDEDFTITTHQTVEQLDELSISTGEEIHCFTNGYYELIDQDWCFFEYKDPIIINQ